ncbi:MAG: DUF4845 domain-containing protein [Pseudomonadota bacterium]|nr:DUF4845 domain-containing protein [Pseudomonadota bacterium]
MVGGGLITIHVVPAYVEYYSVKTSINGIVSDPAEATKSPEEILLDLRKRLNVNNVTDVSDRDIVIKNSQGNLVITIHYHVKAHLFGRFSLLMDFKVKAPPGHS